MNAGADQVDYTDYNDMYQIFDRYFGVTITGKAEGDAGFGASDINTNPNFYDPTRNIATWDTSLGGPGTAANVITEMLKLNGYGGAYDTDYTVDNLLAYVRKGFTPRNSALNGTGLAGVDIGAVDVHDSVPTVTQVTPVPSPTKDDTPNYTFNTDEAGTINYAGDCASGDSTADAGANTITFNHLADGPHTNCDITVTDEYNLTSAVLEVNDFTIDTLGPTVAEVVPVPDPTDDATPNYTFSSTEAGLITYGGDCESSDNSAGVGANPITFDTPLAEGLHNNCTIRVTDAATNQSNLLGVTPFTVDLGDHDPPTDFNLRLPSNGAWVRDATPTFWWYASTDADSGLAGYRLYVDSHLKKSVGSTSTSATFQTPLSQGSHSWYVVARDNEGNTKQSGSTRTIRVDSVKPYLSIISPNASRFSTYGEYIPIKGLTTDKTSRVSALRIYNHTLDQHYHVSVANPYFKRWIRLKMSSLNNITVVAYDHAGNKTKRYLNIYQLPAWASPYINW